MGSGRAGCLRRCEAAGRVLLVWSVACRAAGAWAGGGRGWGGGWVCWVCWVWWVCAGGGW